MAVTRVYKPLLDRFGLTYPQYLVLHALWEQDGRAVGAIARRLFLESSTVTPLLKRLEASGLVARARNPDDEREVKIRLTARGRAMRERCGRLGETLLARSGMSAAELGALNRRAKALRAALADEGV
ncbi:MarR family winged helix-turn-helix transcriptional regulator [Methylocella sp.]|uniref:MarR family winged helix-turn-helix transcriptional regulator n=1 Tax=Methylocella sp. TaxID=1978226 RepID=UPI003782E218